MELLVALDAGTSSVRAIAFDSTGAVVDATAREVQVNATSAGWVEQDAGLLAGGCIQVLQELARRLGDRAADVVAIGITNQRETVVSWDRRDGSLLYPAISWQDARGAALCAQLTKAGHGEEIRARTGLVVNPYFSATKMAWLHAQGVITSPGHHVCATLDSYLLWRLTGGTPDSPFATDLSNASRTMLLDIERLAFDEELAAMVGVDPRVLPELLPTAGFSFPVAKGLPFAGVPVTAMIGDQQASLFGQGCVKPASAKNTYGTGNFLLANSGSRRTRPGGGVLESIAWRLEADPPTYCLEGSIFTTGAVMRWMRDSLGILPGYEEIEAVLARTRTSDGVVFLPAFQGLGAPHWITGVKGAVFGVSQSTTADQLIRAAVEGISLRVEEVVEAIETAIGTNLDSLMVDGGMTRSEALCQLQADQLQMRVHRSGTPEATALGAALMAGLSAGLFPSVDQVPFPSPSGEFVPKGSASAARSRRELYRRYLGRLVPETLAEGAR